MDSLHQEILHERQYRQGMHERIEHQILDIRELASQDRQARDMQQRTVTECSSTSRGAIQAKILQDISSNSFLGQGGNSRLSGDRLDENLQACVSKCETKSILELELPRLKSELSRLETKVDHGLRRGFLRSAEPAQCDEKVASLETRLQSPQAEMDRSIAQLRSTAKAEIELTQFQRIVDSRMQALQTESERSAAIGQQELSRLEMKVDHEIRRDGSHAADLARCQANLASLESRVQGLQVELERSCAHLQQETSRLQMTRDQDNQRAGQGFQGADLSRIHESWEAKVHGFELEVQHSAALMQQELSRLQTRMDKAEGRFNSERTEQLDFHAAELARVLESVDSRWKSHHTELERSATHLQQELDRLQIKEQREDQRVDRDLRVDIGRMQHGAQQEWDRSAALLRQDMARADQEVSSLRSEVSRLRSTVDSTAQPPVARADLDREVRRLWDAFDGRGAVGASPRVERSSTFSGGAVTRTQFEHELQRIWEAIDSHQHHLPQPHALVEAPQSHPRLPGMAPASGRSQSARRSHHGSAHPRRHSSRPRLQET